MCQRGGVGGVIPAAPIRIWDSAPKTPRALRRGAGPGRHGIIVFGLAFATPLTPLQPAVHQPNSLDCRLFERVCQNAPMQKRRADAELRRTPGDRVTRPLLGWHLNASLDSSAPAWSRLPIFIHLFYLWLPLLCAALWRLKPKYRRGAPKASGKSYLPAGRDRNASPRSLGKRIARNGLGPRPQADLGRAK